MREMVEHFEPAVQRSDREPGGSMCGALVIDSIPPATKVPNSPAADQLVGQRDRVQPRKARRVDGDGGHVHRHAAGDRRLPRRIWPQPACST